MCGLGAMPMPPAALCACSRNHSKKTMIVVKLRAARERKWARTGLCEGRKPFGFHPGEKRAVERMRTLRRDGRGYQAIAEALDPEGLPTRKGSPWQAASVRRILLVNQ